MASHKRLTDAAIKKLKLPAAGQEDHFDQSRKRLSLRISAKGKKTWQFVYRFQGKQRRVTLGVYPSMSLAQASTKASDAFNILDGGADPFPPVEKKLEPDAGTVREVAEKWMLIDQIRKGNSANTLAAKRRILNNHLFPALGEKPIQAVTKRDIRQLLDSIQSPTASNAAFRALNRLFNWSVGRGYIDFNPMAGLEKHREKPRERVLTGDELVEVWRAAKQGAYPFGDVVRLMILTGARREEIGSLKWSEVDLDGGEIRLEDHKTQDTAGTKIITLSKAAVAILRKIPKTKGGEYVFSTNGRTPVSGWSKAKVILDRICSVEGWTLHDLRRTMATGLEAMGVALPVTEALLGHVSGSKGGVVGIYQRHQYRDEKRAAVERWADHIDFLLTGKSAKIIPLHGGQ